MHRNTAAGSGLEWSDQCIPMDYLLFFVLETVWYWGCQIPGEKKAANTVELHRN